MPKPDLKPKYNQLQFDIIKTMLAGLNEWRSDLQFPESGSDMQACVHALLREYKIERRPIGLEYKDIIKDNDLATN